jgi:hypothetical protein
MVILGDGLCALTKVNPAIKAGMKDNMVWADVSDDEGKDT